MIFEGRGFVNLQLPNLCTSGFEALFALNHVKTKEISPVLNEKMTYKVFGRQGLAAFQPCCIGDVLAYFTNEQLEFPYE